VYCRGLKGDPMANYASVHVLLLVTQNTLPPSFRYSGDGILKSYVLSVRYYQPLIGPSESLNAPYVGSEIVIYEYFLASGGFFKDPQSNSPCIMLG
jgi:hypothetical protein